MKLRQTQQTIVTGANAGALVQHIVQGVVGNEVADTLQGSPLASGIIQDMAQAKFQQAVSKFLGAK